MLKWDANLPINQPYNKQIVQQIHMWPPVLEGDPCSSRPSDGVNQSSVAAAEKTVWKNEE